MENDLKQASVTVWGAEEVFPAVFRIPVDPEGDAWFSLDGGTYFAEGASLRIRADREVYAVYTGPDGREICGTLGDRENECLPDNAPIYPGEEYCFWDNPRTRGYYVGTEPTPKMPEGFPVGAWEGPRRYAMKNREEAIAQYRIMWDAGIRVLFLFAELADPEWLADSLAAAEAVGIRLIADLGAVWKNPEKLEKTVLSVCESPAVIGFNVVDEPPIGWLDQVGRTVRKLRRWFPNHLVFTNLNPLYAPPGYLGDGENGADPYRQYLEAFGKKVPASCLSFDFYPYVGNPYGEEKMKLLLLKNLAMLRTAADRMGIPLTGFLQSCRWGRYGDNGLWQGTRIPSREEYRFLGSVHLVFGCSMLTDFLYWSRSGKRPDQRVPGVFDGLMTEEGESTEIGRIAGEEIRKIRENGEILSGMTFRGIVPIGLEGKELSAIREVTAENGEISGEIDGKLLLGIFEGKEKSLLFAANWSDSRPCCGTLRLSGGQSAEIRLKSGESAPIFLAERRNI